MQNDNIQRYIDKFQKYNSTKIQRNMKNEIQHMHKIQDYRGQIRKCEPRNTSNFNYSKNQIVE